MNLVENNTLGGISIRSIWRNVASINQLPQHFAFNESAKHYAYPIEM